MTARAEDLPPPARRERLAWCLFDFANSSFTTVIVTVVFARVFVKQIVPEGGYLGLGGDAWWALANGLSQAVVLALAPIVGLLADRRARKKVYLFRTYLTCVGATALLSFLSPGDVLLAVALYFIANIGFSMGENLVAGFLPELAAPSEMGRLSGLGWMLGYFGGLAALLLCLALVHFGWVDLTSLATAIFFGLAGIPTFVWLRERARPSADAETPVVAAAFGGLRKSFGERHRYRDLVRFLQAIFFFQAGISIVIAFSSIYAEHEIGMSDQQIIQLFIGLQFSAAAGAYAFGFLQDRFGSKPPLILSLLVWMASVLTAYLAHSAPLFVVSGLLAGFAMGSSQSSSRALIGLFCPKGREAEWFGLWGLATKGASVLGMLYCVCVIGAAGRRTTVLLTLAFFIVGLLLLLAVDVRRGRRMAEDHPG